MDYLSSPDYLKSADLHNIGSGNESFFDDPIGNIGGVVAQAPSFAITSIASGINSIYNSAVVAGNFFGLTDGAEENDLRQTLGSYDSNLGQYYEAHKQAVDVTGFIATSLVPGMGGVKLFNAGQKALSFGLKSGTIGRSIAETTGLIPTLTAEGKTLVEVAGKALAESQQTFTFMNAGVLKAVAGGAKQAVLESAAFETMVAATMYRSPVLDGQDYKDIASNILTGAALGGVIGTAFHAATLSGVVKKEMSAVDLAQKKWTLRTSQENIIEPGNKLVVAAHDLAITPDAVSATEKSLRADRVAKIQLEMRGNIHSLSTDSVIGNQIADTFEIMSGDSISAAVGGLKKILRPTDLHIPATGEEIAHIKLHGEGAGNATFDALSEGKLGFTDKITPVGKQTFKEAVLQKVSQYSTPWGAKVTPPVWSPLEISGGLDEIEARYIFAKTARYQADMEIHQFDIPLLEGALEKGIPRIQVRTPEGPTIYVSSVDLKSTIESAKLELVRELELAKFGTSDQIARATNVSVKAIESESTGSLFARQDAQAAWNKARADKGLRAGEDLDFIPNYAQVVYDTAGLTNATPDLISAITNIKLQQRVVQEGIDKAVASVTGEDIYTRLYHATDEMMLGANRQGAGSGIIRFANGDYGTLASWSEHVGKVTSDLRTKLHKDTSGIIDSAMLKLRGNQPAAIEFDKINNIVSSSTESYMLNEAGDGLIAVRLQKYLDKVAKTGKRDLEPPVLQEGAPDTIPFVHAETREAITVRIESNGNRVKGMNGIAKAKGLDESKKSDVFYPLKPQPSDYPFFAFVKDESVTGAGMGHTSMIHASSASELEDMIKMAEAKTGFKVYTKSDTEQYFKAKQDYEWDRTLHDNYIDSSLKSAGVNNQFFPKTDPAKIVDSWAELERRADDKLAREVISAKFGKEFDQLGVLGQQYTDVASSRYGTTAKAIESTAKNPYNDYRKAALDISRLEEHPLLVAFNRNLEQSVSRVYQKVVDAWAQTKSVNDLQTVNDALAAAGINHAYKNSAEIVLANHTAPKAYVSQFIRGANSILANTLLRLDPLNALNNAIGAQVLLGAETSSQVKKLLRSPELGGITVPGTTDAISSPTKLIGKANAAWFKMIQEGDASAEKEFFRSSGFLTSLTDQYKSMLDDLALKGTETPNQMNTLLQRGFEKAKVLTEKGEKWTGNRLAEEYNRFISAHVGKQLAEVQGLSGGEMLAYMSTFVNRTQGNHLASQRPLLFQGPIGQAIGLFQSFQFNTMQQLFRHVAEGAPKDAAMMLGLQGTIYGMNGLPGFQFINQHIIGTASGNQAHVDAYSTLYGAAGKTAGDWLMYGIPSNLLQTNIYSRGDINPRTLTIVPTNPADVVAISAFSGFAGNLKETLSKIAGGGDVWQSVLQGLEHNTLSRPLAGLAATLQAADGGKSFSTTNAGDIGFANDFMSLATLSRLGGGKPLDEALANDEAARKMVYQAADRKRMKAATEKFKTSVIGQTSLEPEAVHNYMQDFVKYGGNAQDFNKQLLNVMTSTNTPKANKIIETLKGPYAQRMNQLMNGKVPDLDE